MKIKGLTNPEKKIVMFVGALKMKTFVESLQKQTMGLSLNIQNYQFLNWSLLSFITS